MVADKTGTIAVNILKAGQVVGERGFKKDAKPCKSLEDELIYLNTHDRLTGLFDRNYFMKKLRMYVSNERFPLTVIIADINGLKIVNEVFGLEVGDLLLTKTAEIIKNSTGIDSIAARWSGDEFAITLPNTDDAAADIICCNISNKCTGMEGCPVKPSIALGNATLTSMTQDMNGVIFRAEDRMYRQKLLESQSTHSSIIASLRKALFEKSFETEEHAQRMRKMSMKIGKKIGLSRDEQDELCLLSVLHDIGKIAIPDSILSKPGKLTDVEREEMKRHSEIGYHIAAASNELSSIAEFILSHHERWDGSGYPQGLKGNETPKLARIVAVVDAYDVITSERPYKPALSHDKAIKEIRRCSGTQFEPDIAEAFCSMDFN